MVAAKKGSPVIIGINDDEFFISSDIASIINTKNILYLDENEMIVFNNLSYEVKNISSNINTKEIEYIDIDIQNIEKGEYDHFMLKEIFEQSTAFINSIREELILIKIL